MLQVEKCPEDLKTLLAQNGTVQVLMDLLRDCKLEHQDKRSLLPIVIQSLSLVLGDCTLANDKLEKSHGYEEIFNEINALGGPPDMNILKGKYVLVLDYKNSFIEYPNISKSGLKT